MKVAVTGVGDGLEEGGRVEAAGRAQPQVVAVLVVQVDRAGLDADHLGHRLAPGQQRGVEVEGRVGRRDDAVQAIELRGAREQAGLPLAGALLLLRGAVREQQLAHDEALGHFEALGEVEAELGKDLGGAALGVPDRADVAQATHAGLVDGLDLDLGEQLGDTRPRLTEGRHKVRRLGCHHLVHCHNQPLLAANPPIIRGYFPAPQRDILPLSWAPRPTAHAYGYLPAPAAPHSHARRPYSRRITTTVSMWGVWGKRSTGWR